MKIILLNNDKRYINIDMCYEIRYEQGKGGNKFA